MKAKVIAPTTVNNQPTQIGDIVEVSPITFANLSRKGRLAEVMDETPTEKPAKKGK